MPARDTIHETVKEAVIKDGWEITDDPYVISYGDRFLFVDLGASGFIGLQQGNKQIAIAEIPLKLVIVNLSTKEITQWIPSNPTKQ